MEASYEFAPHVFASPRSLGLSALKKATGKSSCCKTAMQASSTITTFVKSACHESVHTQCCHQHLTQASKHERLAWKLALSKSLSIAEQGVAARLAGRNKP